MIDKTGLCSELARVCNRERASVSHWDSDPTRIQLFNKFFYRICNDFLSQTKADSLVCETNFFLLSPFSLQQYTYLIFNQICLKQIQILTIFLKKLTFQHYKSTGNIIVIKKIKNFQPQYESRTENCFYNYFSSDSFRAVSLL